MFGPTAVGKTDVIASLSDKPIEVISADAMQVYRGMDIGTAKPTSELLARIPHHLIDLCSPDQQYDVGGFVRDAETAARDIVGRGRIPVVSGGTAYYFKHLLFGLPTAPESNPAVRADVGARLERDGIDALYRWLEEVDPDTARKVARADRYRVTRALEVYLQTGSPLSSFPVPSQPRTELDARIVGLRRPREELAERIRRRVEAMFEAGLASEVASLVAAGYSPKDPGLKAIGYREFLRPDGSLRPPQEYPAVREEIVKNTRRYAKRQLTFFRQLPGVRWVEPGDTELIRGLLLELRDDRRSWGQQF